MPIWKERGTISRTDGGGRGTQIREGGGGGQLVGVVEGKAGGCDRDKSDN